MTEILRSRLRLSPRQIAAFCRRHQILVLAIFGSALGEDFTDASDLDLLVTFRPDAAVGFLELARTRRELEELVGRKVDLVPKAGLKALIRDQVLGSAEPLYAA